MLFARAVHAVDDEAVQRNQRMLFVSAHRRQVVPDQALTLLIDILDSPPDQGQNRFLVETARRQTLVQFPVVADRLVAQLGDRRAATAKTTSAHADAGVEAFELPGHPFYLATLFQPPVGSLARGELHPLLAALATTLGGRAGDRDGVAAADPPRVQDVAPDAEVHAPSAAQLRQRLQRREVSVAVVGVARCDHAARHGRGHAQPHGVADRDRAAAPAVLGPRLDAVDRERHTEAARVGHRAAERGRERRQRAARHQRHRGVVGAALAVATREQPDRPAEVLGERLHRGPATSRPRTSRPS